MKKWAEDTVKRMGSGPYAIQRVGRDAPFATGLSLSMVIAVIRECKRRNPDMQYDILIPPQGIAA